MARLKKDEVLTIISSLFNTVSESVGGNWIEVESKRDTEKVFFSQCKSATPGKSHWKYDFFHTLGFQTIQEIGQESGILILMNYEHQLFSILDAADLIWISRFSTRNKSNDGLVCDIVVDRDHVGNYQLRPYDRLSLERRIVEVRKW